MSGSRAFPGTATRTSHRDPGGRNHPGGLNTPGRNTTPNSPGGPDRSDGRLIPSYAACLWAAAGLAALVALLLVLVVLRWAPLMALDTAVADGLHRTAVAGPGWTRTARVLSDWFWDPWTMRAVLALMFLFLLRRREHTVAAWVAVSGVMSAALQQTVKAVVGRERPVWPDPVATAHYAAFPSGHAMTAAVAGATAVWLLRLYGAPRPWRRGVAAVAAVSVAGVGFTRVYLGVHWLTDVVAGWLLGMALVALVAGLHARRPHPHRPHPRAGARGNRRTDEEP
ncbi:phosphatase PAP2 family protein [Streptomyces sp. MST-110588]|nr:phosphatase PAP2 family protein [Streptomyces sp. MST-110588]